MRTLYISYSHYHPEADSFSFMPRWLCSIIAVIHPFRLYVQSYQLYTLGHQRLVHIDGSMHQFRFHSNYWLHGSCIRVAILFIYYPALPVIKVPSVVISYWLGFSARWYYRYHPHPTSWQMMLGMAIGFLLPYIAGIFTSVPILFRFH